MNGSDHLILIISGIDLKMVLSRLLSGKQCCRVIEFPPCMMVSAYWIVYVRSMNRMKSFHCPWMLKCNSSSILMLQLQGLFFVLLQAPISSTKISLLCKILKTSPMIRSVCNEFTNNPWALLNLFLLHSTPKWQIRYFIIRITSSWVPYPCFHQQRTWYNSKKLYCL